MNSLLAALFFAYAPAGTAGAPCAEPMEARAPDPRCGEALDGRAPPEPAGELLVPRVALAVPRLFSLMVLRPVTEGLEFVEDKQVFAWMDALLTSDDGKVGVRPELEYASGFLPRGGLRFFYRRWSSVALMARVRSAGSSALLTELALHFPVPELTARAAFSTQGDRLFGGLGPKSEADLEAQGVRVARYGAETLLAEAGWSHTWSGQLASWALGDLQHVDYRSDDLWGGPSVGSLYGLRPEQCLALGLPVPCVHPGVLPGFTEGMRIAHLGAGLALGTRARARDGKGARLAVDARYGHGLGPDPSQHVRLSAEALLSLGGDDRLLLLRARAAMVERLASAAVPFEELVMPSAKAEMRGFPIGRFRGESALFGTAEYRWLIAFNLDAALFVDLGTFAEARFAGLQPNRLFPSYGLAFRYYGVQTRYWEGRPTAGLQLTYAPDSGVRFMVALSPY